VTREERFWDKVQKTDTCWLWIGSTNQDGYGRFNIGGKLGGAHRYSFELHTGEIPEGMHVLHTCDTPACVRPDHLFLGTHSDNMQDMYRKRRHNKWPPMCRNHPDRRMQSLGLCRACYIKDWHEKHPEKAKQYYLKYYHGIQEPSQAQST